VIPYPTDVPLAYPDLEEIIKHALPSEGNFAILAESYSGPIAVRIAAKNPRGLRALILVGTFVTTPRRLYPGVATPLMYLASATPMPYWVIRRFLLGSDSSVTQIQEFRSVIDLVRPAVLAKRLRDTLRVDVREELKSCACPILFVVATEDKLVPARAWKQARETRGDIEFVQIRGPHLLLQAKPGLVANRVDRFLGDLLQGGVSS